MSELSPFHGPVASTLPGGVASEGRWVLVSDGESMTSSPDEPSPEEWEQIKTQALELLAARMLDTPQAHLAYIRRQLAAAKAFDVLEE